MTETGLKHVILRVEGIVTHTSQVPDDVELIVVDEEVYTEPMLDYTREDLAPYEECATCGCVKKEHHECSLAIGIIEEVYSVIESAAEPAQESVPDKSDSPADLVAESEEEGKDG